MLPNAKLVRAAFAVSEAHRLRRVDRQDGRAPAIQIHERTALPQAIDSTTIVYRCADNGSDRAGVLPPLRTHIRLRAAVVWSIDNYRTEPAEQFERSQAPLMPEDQTAFKYGLIGTFMVQGSGAIHVGMLFAAILFWWLCRVEPASLPFWAPWEFSWVEFLSAWLAVYWYLRGIVHTPAERRPSGLRQVAFLGGVFLVYIVLETRFEYLAEHQFFYNRMQHVVLHHLSPLLIALSWPAATLWNGMPGIARRLFAHRVALKAVRASQQPVLAPILFSGSFFIWLVPSIHFRAMIDPDLYAAMNWSMLIDGILFWSLVLDPRPAPPARLSFPIRGALAFAVAFPQILGGAVITFSSRDFYKFYDLCGRIYPGLDANFDQTMGGLIVWIPPAMMSLVAILMALNALRKDEERALSNGTVATTPS